MTQFAASGEGESMAENPRQNARQKGFWDGGPSGHGHNKESSGRPSGYPGTRRQSRTGINTDFEFPAQNEEKAKPEE
jgi:hypothetical protein